MSDAYIGQISIYSFNYPPKGWAFCNGQTLAISQNQALFSLLGTYYGGNGQTTFQLPNLQGKLAVGQGQGPGLTNRIIGETGGESAHTLIVQEIPAHTHQVNYTGTANSLTPSGDLWAPDPNGNLTFASAGSETLDATAVAQAGGSQPHNNIQPVTVVTFSICLSGIFPSRN
jgi:microcystin-dependent protein